jgi:hypothetical protein
MRKPETSGKRAASSAIASQDNRQALRSRAALGARLARGAKAALGAPAQHWHSLALGKNKLSFLFTFLGKIAFAGMARKTANLVTTHEGWE